MLFRRIAALAFGIALAFTTGAGAAPPGMEMPPQPKVRPAGIPAGYVMVSPCVQAMGEHWANPKNLEAPIYGTYDGKVVFSEIMIPKAVLVRGFSYDNLTPLPGHTINHVDIDYEPHGHAGMPIPHYDIHAYYVSHAAHLKYCPNGAPNPHLLPTG